MKNNILQKNSPSGWREVRLGDVADISAGGTPSTTVSAYWNHGNVPWAKSGEINKRRIYKTENFITKLGLEESSAKIVPENSVLIALAGQGSTRGKVAINNISLATNQSIAFFVPASKLDYRFLFLDLDRRYAELRSISAGDGGRGGLNLSLLKSLKIKLPEISEQKRIVAVLETWDQAIEKLAEKIKVKKNIRKGLMCNLLTGKVRLSRFLGKWKTSGFTEIFDVLKKPNGLKLEEYLELGNFPIVDQSKDKIISGYTNQQKYIYDFEKKPVIVFGDHSRIFKCVNQKVAFGNDGIKLFSGKTILDTKFGYYLLNNLRIPETGYNRHFKYLRNAVFKIPGVKEQEAIANVLTAADNGIEALEKKLSILKEQKKFLLNNLITGVIRVPEGSSAKK